MNDYEDCEIFKVIVIGEVGTGKTSIIKRYCENTYSDNYKSTIGVDFGVKKISHLGQNFLMQLWDVGGQERFACMTRIFYKNAIAVLIVFDLSNLHTFDKCKLWMDDVRKNLDTPHLLYLIANKSDINDNKITKEEIINFCQKYDFDNWAIVSAKTDTGINCIFESLMSDVYHKCNTESISIPTNTVNFINENKNKNKNCCF